MNRKLDALVAEHVMGWEVIGGPPIVRFSSSIAAAWMVMERMLAGEYAYEFAVALMESCGVIDTIGHSNADLTLRILNSLTPKRICLAALRALGVPIPEEE